MAELAPLPLAWRNSPVLATGACTASSALGGQKSYEEVKAETVIQHSAALGCVVLYHAVTSYTKGLRA